MHAGQERSVRRGCRLAASAAPVVFATAHSFVLLNCMPNVFAPVQCLSTMYQEDGPSLPVDQQLCRRKQSEVLCSFYGLFINYFCSLSFSGVIFLLIVYLLLIILIAYLMCLLHYCNAVFSHVLCE